MNQEDIQTLSTCDGMLDILEKAIQNMQAMPENLHMAIIKASILRKERGWANA